MVEVGSRLVVIIRRFEVRANPHFFQEGDQEVTDFVFDLYNLHVNCCTVGGYIFVARKDMKDMKILLCRNRMTIAPVIRFEVCLDLGNHSGEVGDGANDTLSLRSFRTRRLSDLDGFIGRATRPLPGFQSPSR